MILKKSFISGLPLHDRIGTNHCSNARAQQIKQYWVTRWDWKSNNKNQCAIRMGILDFLVHDGVSIRDHQGRTTPPVGSLVSIDDRFHDWIEAATAQKSNNNSNNTNNNVHPGISIWRVSVFLFVLLQMDPCWSRLIATGVVYVWDQMAQHARAAPSIPQSRMERNNSSNNITERHQSEMVLFYKHQSVSALHHPPPRDLKGRVNFSNRSLPPPQGKKHPFRVSGLARDCCLKSGYVVNQIHPWGWGAQITSFPCTWKKTKTHTHIIMSGLAEWDQSVGLWVNGSYLWHIWHVFVQSHF